jgi:hypothetical protein
MIEISRTDGLEITEGSALVDHVEQAGRAKSATKYKTDTGFVVEFINKAERTYVYMEAEEDRSLDSLLRANCSHLNDEEKEIELYRWGLEEPKAATTESFGAYRLLLTNAAGHINWYKEGARPIIYSSLAEALSMCKSKLLAKENPMVI